MVNKPAKVLGSVFPDGDVPDWYIPEETHLKLIPDFKRRLEEAKNSIETDCGDVAQLRQFAIDFFAAWEVSSFHVIEECGPDCTIDIFELFALDRELLWGYEYVSVLNQISDEIEIFRGGQGSIADLLKGFSWSMSEQFAQQYAYGHENGTLIKASIAKDDVLFISGNEWEVVPRNSELRDIVKIY